MTPTGESGSRRRQRLVDRRRVVGLSQERLAEAVGVDRKTVARWETTGSWPQPQQRPRLAKALGVSMEQLQELLRMEGPPVRRRRLLAAGGAAAAGTVLPGPPRIAQALDIVTSNGADTIGIAVESLTDLTAHYSERLSVFPPATVYTELLAVRAYAAALAEHAGSSRWYPDVVVAIGWLSNLLAVASSYSGDHATAVVWCGDAERRSRTAGLPELAGWAALTRATIAYYQGQAGRSLTYSVRGQAAASIGTVVHAKLAAQEMRARAMLGDADGMNRARSHAGRAIAAIPSTASSSGVFSLPMSEEDPPYTGTSLLLVNRFQDAARVTRSVIRTAWPSAARGETEPPSNYARALLVLALAEAGLGNGHEAAGVGLSALQSAGIVWPTLVLAGKLDRVLGRDFRGSAETAEFHGYYLDAVASVGGRAGAGGD
jgi:transcriptional regulator with XRE-family HTH domain